MQDDSLPRTEFVSQRMRPDGFKPTPMAESARTKHENAGRTGILPVTISAFSYQDAALDISSIRSHGYYLCCETLICRQ